MKEFDLEKARAGAPLITRDGRKAKFLAHAPECEITYRLIVLIEGESSADFFSEGGKFLLGEKSDNDLFMVPQKVVRYINIRQDTRLHISAAAAEESASYMSDLVAIAVPVEIEI